MKLQIEDGLYDGVTEIDLVGVLYNLLDNAIEANERIAEGFVRGIELNLWKDEKEIKIWVKNRIMPGEKVDFRTRKADKEIHGYGIGIIEKIVQKYHGKKEITFNQEENCLSFLVCL